MAVDISENFEVVSFEEQRLASRQLAAPRLPGYEMVEFLGAGTFGDVWKARDTASQVLVAIKRLRGEPDAQSCAEVEKLATLSSSRGIVALREVHLSSEPYCYVMEYLSGGTLADLIREKGSLPLNQAWGHFSELIDALAYVHREGIVHCDLKPENVMLDGNGHPRLVDFGQARGRGPHGSSLGTRFYMPPEQARMETIPDPRWDVYAMGVILYEMLTGQKPRFDQQLSQLLSTPTGSGSELRNRLEQYAKHLESTARPAAHRHVKAVDGWKAKLIEDCLALEFDRRIADAMTVRQRIADCNHAAQSRPLLIFGAIAPAAMLLLFGILMLVSSWWTFAEISQKFAALTQANNPSAAKAVAAAIQDDLNQAIQIVQEEARSHEVRDLITRGNHDELLPLMQKLFEKNKDSVDRWSITDENGFQLANWGRIPSEENNEDRGTVGDNFAWRGWFNGEKDEEQARSADPQPRHLQQFQSRSERPFISQPYRRKGDEQFVVVNLSCPILSADRRERLGVLAAQWTEREFFKNITAHAEQLAKGGQDIVLVNRHGQVMFHSDRKLWIDAGGGFNDFHSPEFPEYSAPQLEKYLARNQPASFEYRDPFTGSIRSAAAARVTLESGQPLVVLAQQDDLLDDLSTRLYAMAAVLLILGSVFMLLNSYALYWMLKQQRESLVNA